MDKVAVFEEWYRITYSRVVASMIAAAGSTELGRDAADEAFTRALERWDRVSDLENRDGWVYTVALNVIRRKERRRVLELRLLRRWYALDERPPETLPIEVWDAVRALTPRQRQAVALRYLGALTEAQVGEAMGITAGAVARLLHDARRELAGRLTPEEAIGSAADGRTTVDD